MRAIHVLVAVAAMFLIAWSPSPADLGAVKDSPEKFKGKELEITAPIAENSAPVGAEFRKWSFVLDSCGKGGLVVEEEGFNPATIEKAYRLIEEARLKGDEVTVAGKLEEDPDAGFRMKVVWVRYGDTKVNTDEGPFAEAYYWDDIYPGSPT
ncbi:MAG: hypothetical protein C4532_14810, partial [Candidatus Abyssobacteria bacterium SURF_17]